MAQVLIQDLEQDILARLERRAQENGRTLQAELHDILARAVTVSMVEARRRADEIRAKIGGPLQPNSADLIAEDRAR